MHYELSLLPFQHVYYLKQYTLQKIDTKPHQVLVFNWNKNQLSVKDILHDKQKVLKIHLPVDNPDLAQKFLLEYIKPKIKYFFYFEDQIHRNQFTEAVIKLFKKNSVKIYECTYQKDYIRGGRRRTTFGHTCLSPG